MNNILDFLQYKEQVRLYEESLVKSQILEPIEEGLRSKIRQKINAKAEMFVRAALSDEIEMGKQLNEQIQEAVNELKEYIEKIQQAVDDSNPEKSEFFKKIEKIFEDIRKSSFELLEILSGVKINFADYVQNATMATFVNFGVMFIPSRSIFLLKKSYKYFIGLIKNTIRKDLLMLMLNFDQFENTVLIQSLEDDENMKKYDEIKSKMSLVDEIQRRLLSDEGGKKRVMSDKEMKKLSAVTNDIKKGIELQMKVNDRISGSIGFDTRYDNTYTKTLDQLKGFVLEDDSKYLEAIKAGMRTQALDEVDTKSYVELLISAAEECAFEVSNAIHTNFIEKVSVFKLANQKRLIELVKKDKELFEKQRAEEEKKRLEELDKVKNEKLEKAIKEEGPKIFKKIAEDTRNESAQIKEFERLGEIEVDGEKYNEKELLNSWLSLFDKDSNTFKNWEDKRDLISAGLKLYLSDVVPNEDSYRRYSDILVDCLLPCACLKDKSFNFSDWKMIFGNVESEEISESKETDKSDTIKTEMDFETFAKMIKYFAEKSLKEEEKDDKSESGTESGEKISSHIKMHKDSESVSFINAFTILELKSNVREKMFRKSICRKKAEDVEDVVFGRTVKWKKFESDDSLVGLWRKALKLISENLVKLDEDLILETIRNLFNNKLKVHFLSEKSMNRIKEQLEKLEKLKDNDYNEVAEASADEKKEKES